MHIAFMGKTDEDRRKAFGRRLKQARLAKRRGMSAAEAARQMRVPEPTYQAHENGSRDGSDNVEKYARFYRVNWRWLLKDEGSMDGDPDESLFAELDDADKAQVRGLMEFLKSKRKMGEIG